MMATAHHYHHNGHECPPLPDGDERSPSSPLEWQRATSAHHHHHAVNLGATSPTTAWDQMTTEQWSIRCSLSRDPGPHQDRTRLRQERDGSAWQQAGWWMRGIAASRYSSWCQVSIWFSDSFSQCWHWMHVARSKSYGIFFLSVGPTFGSPKGWKGAWTSRWWVYPHRSTPLYLTDI